MGPRYGEIRAAGRANAIPQARASLAFEVRPERGGIIGKPGRPMVRPPWAGGAGPSQFDRAKSPVGQRVGAGMAGGESGPISTGRACYTAALSNGFVPQICSFYSAKRWHLSTWRERGRREQGNEGIADR